jgi:hypothetical protein
MVTIRGTAYDSSIGKQKVSIVLNDTISKLFGDHDKMEKALKNKKLYLQTDAKGRFRITAQVTDSIHFKSYDHLPQAYLISDLAKMKAVEIRLEPEECVPYEKCNETNSNLYVIVGEKISVKRAKRINYCNTISFDSKFISKYKLLQSVIGNYQSDTVSFVAYDHYGTPAFSQYDHVLLYIVESCDELFHVKYQFSNVYRTVDGRWAAPYQPMNYSNYGLDKTIKPEIIKWAETISFNIKDASQEWIERFYPNPYYNISGDVATPVYGNYIEDLIEIKRQTRTDLNFK